jgi:hypothetical protein
VIFEIETGLVLKPDAPDQDSNEFGLGASGVNTEYKVSYYFVKLFNTKTVKAILTSPIGYTARLKRADRVVVVKAADGKWYIVSFIPSIDNGINGNPRLDKNTISEEYSIGNRKTGSAVVVYPNGACGIEASKYTRFWAVPGFEALNGHARRLNIDCSTGTLRMLQDDDTGDVALRYEGKVANEDEPGVGIIHIGKHEDENIVASIAIHPEKKVKKAKINAADKGKEPWGGKWDGEDRRDWNTKLKFSKDGTLVYQTGKPTDANKETEAQLTLTIKPDGNVTLSTKTDIHIDAINYALKVTKRIDLDCDNYELDAKTKAIIRSVAVDIGKEALEPIVKKTFYDFFVNKFAPYIDNHQHGGIQYGGGFTQAPISKSPKPDSGSSLTKNVKAG